MTKSTLKDKGIKNHESKSGSNVKVAMGDSTKKTKQKKAKETPLMKQYYRIKSKYADAILLFRVGDFYETFEDDARKVARILGIVLTKRANGSASHVALAGFPHHSLDTYLPKLVRAGYRVAICDQLEDPKKTKTIVKRGVTELVTPGVAVNDKILDHNKNNFLASLHFDIGQEQRRAGVQCGISFLDISTGEFLLAEGSLNYIQKLIQSFNPTEIIFSSRYKKYYSENFGTERYYYCLDDWVFQEEFTEDELLRHFETNSLKGYGVEEKRMGIIAAGAILHYLKETEHHNSAHISNIAPLANDDFVWLDKFSIRNLELLQSNHEKGTALISILDQTVTAMGARLLKKWLLFPLKNINTINARLDKISHLIENESMADLLNDQFKEIVDLERLMARVSMRKISPRGIRQLLYSLESIAPIKEALSKSKLSNFHSSAQQLDLCESLQKTISDQIVEDAPVQVGKEKVFKEGVSKELDDLRSIASSGKEYLLQIQKREIEKTGISSLKISFNNVFGYYLKVYARFES